MVAVKMICRKDPPPSSEQVTLYVLSVSVVATLTGRSDMTVTC
jgi:hypothetical protein